MTHTEMTATEWRDNLCYVTRRIQEAEAAGPGNDPIWHRLDEYRACAEEIRVILRDIEA